MPEGYPDAVTLDSAAAAYRVLGYVDASAGCSIKDSFAALDLSPWGFAPLFDASWMSLRPDEASVPPARLRWMAVRDPAELATWELAWRGGASGSRLFIPGLLDRPEVAVLAGYKQTEIAAGGILNRSGGAVGISNVFARSHDLDEAFAGCVASALTRFPGGMLVGYEAGQALEAARRVGFRAIGRLVVWLRG